MDIYNIEGTRIGTASRAEDARRVCATEGGFWMDAQGYGEISTPVAASA